MVGNGYWNLSLRVKRMDKIRGISENEVVGYIPSVRRLQDECGQFDFLALTRVLSMKICKHLIKACH